MKVTTLKPELFAAAARFISTEETRYHLQGVFIEPAPAGGIIMVATDGHRFFAGFDPEGETDGSYIIAPTKIKMAAPWFKCQGNAAVAVFEGGETARLTAPGVGIIEQAKIIDGTFPDWRRVIPRAPSGVWDSKYFYNVDYLAEFGDVAKKISGGVNNLNINPNGDGPALIGFGDRDDCFGILAPLRFNTTVAVPAVFLGETAAGSAAE